MENKMTNIEYDVLDELYFVLTYQELSLKLGIDSIVLEEVIKNLFQKGWIKLIEKESGEEIELMDATTLFQNPSYVLLATKLGLKIHNSN